MNVGKGIVIAGALVALSIIATNRYEVIAPGDVSIVIRHNKLTGNLVYCRMTNDSRAMRLQCN